MAEQAEFSAGSFIRFIKDRLLFRAKIKTDRSGKREIFIDLFTEVDGDPWEVQLSTFWTKYTSASRNPRFTSIDERFIGGTLGIWREHFYWWRSTDQIVVVDLDEREAARGFQVMDYIPIELFFDIGMMQAQIDQEGLTSVSKNRAAHTFRERLQGLTDARLKEIKTACRIIKRLTTPA